MVRLILMVLLLSGCSSAPVIRYDPNPAPLDVNYHTALIESCGKISMGLSGCNYPTDIAVYSPLPGSITLHSKECGIDRKIYHPKGGRFSFSNLIPEDARFCVISIYSSWELPQGMTTEFPLRGQSGKVYYLKTEPLPMRWDPPHEILGRELGVAFNQLRENRGAIVIELPEKEAGAYEIHGCGHAVTGMYDTDKVEIPTDGLSSFEQGSCYLFGKVGGRLIGVGLNIFGKQNVKLAADVRLGPKGEVCYSADDTVSLVAFNGEGKFKREACFKAGVGPIGFFTHQGRATYAYIDKSVTWIR